MNDGTILMQRDFLPELLENMQAQLSALARKVDDNTSLTSKVHEQTLKTNGRVTQAEKDIKALQQGKKKFEPDTRLLYLIAMGCLVTLIIVAKLLKVNLGGIL